MKTLEQLLAVGRYTGLGLLLTCTANTADKNNSGDSGSEDTALYDTGDTGDTSSESCVAWEQTFGGSEYDSISSVQQTNDGGYALAGTMYSFESQGFDGLLIKTDGDGNKQWEQTFGGSDDDQIKSLQQTMDEGYVMAGYTYSSGAGGMDGWLVKTDADGNKQWEKTFGGSESDYIYSVQQTTDGGYVLVGYTDSFGAGESDGWLVKTDGEGSKQWEQTFGRSKYESGFLSVVQTTDGGYVLAGYMNSSGAGSYDSWLVKTCDK
ncbi:hypothetical protein HZA99_04910 [Candidatus Woesearchaeota archaeon]|nr:hypothetical protein [Candidatus Woesearchaeota archaeon]